MRIGDDVVAQERLLREQFGIERLQLVIGGSMGAQQTYEWAVRFPDKVLRARADRRHRAEHPARLPLHPGADASRSGPTRAGTAASTSPTPSVTERPQAPRAHLGGDGLLHRVLEAGGVAGAGVRVQGGSSSRASWSRYFTAMDPNDLLTMAWKWQRGDVARHTGGDLAAALGRITAKTFVMPIDEDMFFPPRDCRPSRS